MEKRLLCGEEVSLLGFGAMRLPTQEDGTIDRVKAGRLVDTLYQNGVNYFDTAYVYHQGESEDSCGAAKRIISIFICCTMSWKAACRRIQILTCVSWITYWNRKPRDISVTWEFLRMGSCRCWKDT